MASSQTLIQLLVYLVVLAVLAWPLGKWLAAVAEGRLPRWMSPFVKLENAVYRLAGVDGAESMSWKRYALAVVAFNVLGVVVVYALQRIQAVLPLNPQGFAAVSADSSFDTAVAFVTNTDWQGLRRRIDDELSHPDARADGAELLLGRHRHRRRLGADPRLRGAIDRLDRQLLGRPDPLDVLRPAADLSRLRGLPRRPGRHPERRRLQRRDDARGQCVPAAEERPRRPAAEGCQGARR